MQAAGLYENIVGGYYGYDTFQILEKNFNVLSLAPLSKKNFNVLSLAPLSKKNLQVPSQDTQTKQSQTPTLSITDHGCYKGDRRA